MLVEAAALDPAVFVDRFCWLQPKEGGPAERFRLRDYQQETLHLFDTEQRTLVLKARQLGMSWLADAYALWLASFNSGITVLMFSVGLREAKEELKRVKFMHQRLPDAVRRQKGYPESMEHLEFPGMDSRILSLPSGEDTGTSFTAQLVIVQELAKIGVIESLLTALNPVIGNTGKFIGVSTAKGFGNTFERMWKACEGKLSPHWEPGAEDSPYTPIFVPSSAHPERDDAWHSEMRRAMRNERDFRQEYPETPDEAFQLAGESPFADYFSRSTHHTSYVRPRTVEGVHPDQRWPVWRGVDFGLNVAIALWAEVQGVNVIVYDEIYAENKTTDELGDLILERDLELGLTTMNVRAGADPAGSARNAQTAIPDIAILTRKGIPIAQDRNGRLARVKPADRVGLIQHLLGRPNDPKHPSPIRLLVNCDRCPNLATALERAEWDRISKDGVRKDTYRKDGLYEHPLDGLGYLLINVFPPVGSSAAVETAAVVLPFA